MLRAATLRSGSLCRRSSLPAARACRRLALVQTRASVHTPGPAVDTHLAVRRRTMEQIRQQPPELVPQAEAAWKWFNDLGAPKYWVRNAGRLSRRRRRLPPVAAGREGRRRHHAWAPPPFRAHRPGTRALAQVAPMVDQSELAFRQLCRRHGATAAYTPMLHARLFLETPAYRAEHFTTTPTDRPLLTQFCANDPDILLRAAQLVEAHCDGVDLNLGCPQRIARRGKYGAFLMDDLPLVERMVRRLATDLAVPVTVKIRRFSSIKQTVEYAQVGVGVGVGVRRQGTGRAGCKHACHAPGSLAHHPRADAGACRRQPAGHPRPHAGAEAGERGAG